MCQNLSLKVALHLYGFRTAIYYVKISFQNEEDINSHKHNNFLYRVKVYSIECPLVLQDGVGHSRIILTLG